MANDFLSKEQESHTAQSAKEAGYKYFGRLIIRDHNVGDVIKLDYSEAIVLVHDHMRKKVGGLPLGCFLVATRLEPDSYPDPDDEDTALVLLRVLGPASLPNTPETDAIRFAIGQRVAQEDVTWDNPERVDQYTLHLLRYSGLRCRVLGTFTIIGSAPGNWQLNFGADLNNFYSGRGMKVYKPHGEALNMIVNFPKSYDDEDHPLRGHRIAIGRVRYAASERASDKHNAIAITMDPTDLLARRTALFGMSRTGKSNTTKVIAAAVFQLRKYDAQKGRVGQLILDANGEYANDNPQDQGALRSIWQTTSNSSQQDVVTYGLFPHPNDPNRRLVKLNFLGTNPRDWRDRGQVVEALTPLIQGKDIVDEALSRESAKYITAFRNVSFEVPEVWDDSTRTRYQRMIAAYRAVLVQAGFAAPTTMARANLKNLTNNELRRTLQSTMDYMRVGTLFDKEAVSWDEAYEAWEGLYRAISDRASGYVTFNQNYKNQHDGRDWHDTNLLSILAITEHRGGLRLLGQLAEQHAPQTTRDYADEIVDHLHSGRLVIVDQSSGDPEMNKAAAERLMWKVFEAQKAIFVQPKNDGHGGLIPPPDIMVYIEEAHNLLPAKSDNLSTVWSRMAKEGSKYRIGLVYATQEPSSIQPNILKNTDNWFVAHLNNGDEVRELRKYYDFDDFTQQILMVPEPGFLRMRTLSNPYIVPVQIKRFQSGEG